MSEIQKNNSILEAFKQEFPTNCLTIFVHSLGREVSFREIRVIEQKTLSKLIIDANGRKDKIYKAQVALISQLCLDNTVDIYSLTEFDRIKIMLELYQSNYFKEGIKFKCTSCQKDNIFNMDFKDVISKLNDIEIGGKELTIEDETKKYHFLLAFPRIKHMQIFHEFHAKVKDAGSNAIDMFDLFITGIEIYNKETDKSLKAATTLDDMTMNEIEEILGLLPQHVLYGDDGVLSYINKEMFSIINQQFNIPTCKACGAVQEEVVNATDFFI